MISTNSGHAKFVTSAIFLKTASIYLQIRHMDRLSLTTSRSSIKSTFIHLLLVLLLSGQEELNPRSTTLNKSSTFSTNCPCGICQKKVNFSHHSLLCDKYELWFHTDCLECPVSNCPTLLNLTSFPWIYADCGYSNYSHGAPHLTPILSCTSSYSILTDCSSDDDDLPNNQFLTLMPTMKPA